MVESGDLNAFAEPTVAFEQPGLLPLAELQLRAAQICQDTLQLDAPPRHDEDVMELGADSLALMTMLTEMERVFNQRVDIEAFFANPTTTRRRKPNQIVPFSNLFMRFEPSCVPFRLWNDLSFSCWTTSNLPIAVHLIF